MVPFPMDKGMATLVVSSPADSSRLLFPDLPMYHKRILLLLISLSSLLASGLLFAEGPFTLKECIEAIQKSRETNIRSAILDIRIEDKYNDPVVPVEPFRVMRCYLDGEKMRRDSLREVGSSQVISAAIWSEGKIVLRVPESEQGAVSVMVGANDMPRKRHEILAYLMLPDIRFLGTYLFWYNMYNGQGWILTPEAIFGLEKPLDVQLDPSTGATVLRWECRLDDVKREFRAFVHPDKEWSVSKIELVDLIDGKEVPVIVTSIRNKTWSTGNVIFPEQIITDYYDGGVHYRTETVSISNARLNVSVAPTVFELKDMSLPEGIVIHDETVRENQLFQWSARDGKAVPWTGGDSEQYDLPEVVPTRVILFRVVCMTVGLLMIIFALTKMWRDKRTRQ